MINKKCDRNTDTQNMESRFMYIDTVATILDPHFKKWYFQEKEKYEVAVNFLKDALKRRLRTATRIL